MKVGFLISPAAMVSGASSGVRQQSLVWKNGLTQLGISVDLLDSWGDHNWSSYDIIHIFQSGDWLRSIVPSLRKRVKVLFFSPIIDTTQSSFAYRLASNFQVKKLRLRTENVVTAEAAKMCDCVLARSSHEFDIVTKGLGVEGNRVKICHIGYKKLGLLGDNKREPVCLHVSSYSQPRKNVIRLIEACKKSDIPLWLVGNGGSLNDRRRVERAVGGDSRIKIHGFLSDSELSSLYGRARIFALPSLNEGVGLSALEAASAGCEVVITKRGGPPDYFSNLANYVDPSSVSSISEGILNAVCSSYQPNLKEHVDRNFSEMSSAQNLLHLYSQNFR